MLIALDFDRTYTLDPETWNIFIRVLREKGHDIICVTSRYPEENWYIEDSIGQVCKIFYTSRTSKRDFVNRLGIDPDVWIDDDPEFINRDHPDKKMYRFGE